MMESIHKKLDRVRKPRVHIKYEVETEDAVFIKELPFVVGVIGDFSGDSVIPQKPLKDRKFAEIDCDSMDEIMRKISPGLNFRVKNILENSANEAQKEMSINLAFNSMEDFDPARVVENIPVLKNLLDTRNKLRDLLTKIDRSENLENLLEKILQDSEELKKLSNQLEVENN